MADILGSRIDEKWQNKKDKKTAKWKLMSDSPKNNFAGLIYQSGSIENGVLNEMKLCKSEICCWTENEGELFH